MSGDRGLLKIIVRDAWRGIGGYKKLYFWCIVIATMLPILLYQVSNSVMKEAELQKFKVYGRYSHILYQTDGELNKLGYDNEELKKIVPEFVFGDYGVSTILYCDFQDENSLHLGYSDDEAQELSMLQLKEGKMPEAENEIALTEQMAELFGRVSIGDQVHIHNLDYTISGIVSNYGRLWVKGETQVDNHILPVNVFVSKQRAEQLLVYCIVDI